MMGGEREELRIEPDRVAVTFKDGALEIVVQQDPGQTGPCFEGACVAGQKAVHACIEEEAQINLPRPREHHHEGHQRSSGPPNLKVIEMCPVNLSLLTWQCS